MELEHAVRSGVVIGFAVSLLVFFFIYDERGAFIRRLGFLAGWFVIDILATTIITVALLSQRAVSAIVYGNFEYLTSYFRDSIVVDIAIAFFVFLMIVLALQLRRLIGEGIMWKVVTGRYHEPRRENRVFMFLDIRDSTAIAEKIGDEKTHALITDVFFHADRKITEHRGEILSYNGDEIVASWPSPIGLEKGRCLSCYSEISKGLSEKAEEYKSRFGVAPSLWVGLHEGPVVVGECGDSKLAIVHIGDTPNTAARLEHMAKELGCECLVSEGLKSRVEVPEGISFESKGTAILRGHSHETQLFAVSGSV